MKSDRMILAAVNAAVNSIAQEAWKKKKKKKRKEKIQYLNWIWTRDLAIPVRCSNQWSHRADLFHIHLSQTWRRLKRIAIALFENLLN